MRGIRFVNPELMFKGLVAAHLKIEFVFYRMITLCLSEGLVVFYVVSQHSLVMIFKMKM